MNNDDEDHQSKIVQIQIHKYKFNGEDVKLVIVRNMDFLILQQNESQKIKKEQMINKLFQKELVAPLNIVVTKSRMLIDDILLLKNDVKKVARGEDTAIIKDIWSQSRILDYLLQSIKSRKRFQEENSILNLTEIRQQEIDKNIKTLLQAFSPQANARGFITEFQNKIKNSQIQ